MSTPLYLLKKPSIFAVVMISNGFLRVLSITQQVYSMQQVNLYYAQYPPKENVKIPGKVSVFVIIVVVTVIAGSSVFYWKIETLRKEYESFKQASSIAQNALNQVKTSIKDSATDDEIKIDLLNLKQKLKHKQALKDRLYRESNEVFTSFYQRFVALSNQDLPGLWLREIKFDDNGKEMTLIGVSRKAELVTQYIQQLSSDPIFSGVTFNVLQLNNANSASTDQAIEFTLSTDELSNPAQEMLGDFVE